MVIAASDKKQVEMKVAKIGRISKIDIIQAIGEKFKKGGKLVTDSPRIYSEFAKSEKLNQISLFRKNIKQKQVVMCNISII